MKCDTLKIAVGPHRLLLLGYENQVGEDSFVITVYDGLTN